MATTSDRTAFAGLFLFAMAAVWFSSTVITDYSDVQALHVNAKRPLGANEPDAAASSVKLPGHGTLLPNGKKRVIAFSLFKLEKDVKSGVANVTLSPFSAGVLHNLYMKQTVYPDWFFRLYMSDSIDQAYVDVFEALGIEVIRMPFKQSEWMMGMFWRFLPADDVATIDRFIVRDLDSRLNTREKYMVDEWIKDGTALHSIRDHPWHNIEILGGMWGGVGGMMRYARPSTDATMAQLFDEYGGGRSTKGDDQKFLALSIWPKFMHNVTQHDLEGKAWGASESAKWMHPPPDKDIKQERCRQPEHIGKECNFFVGAYFKLEQAMNETYNCPDDGSYRCTLRILDFRDAYSELAGGKAWPF